MPAVSVRFTLSLFCLSSPAADMPPVRSLRLSGQEWLCGVQALQVQ